MSSTQKITRPVNPRPVQDGDIVRVFGFSHPPGRYYVEHIGTVMTVVRPLTASGKPASFGMGAKHDDLILDLA